MKDVEHAEQNTQPTKSKNIESSDYPILTNQIVLSSLLEQISYITTPSITSTTISAHDAIYRSIQSQNVLQKQLASIELPSFSKDVHSLVKQTLSQEKSALDVSISKDKYENPNWFENDQTISQADRAKYALGAPPGTEKSASALHYLLSKTCEKGENTAGLLVGLRGEGKSATLRWALAKIHERIYSATNTLPFVLITLSGIHYSNDKLAIIEAIRQTCSQLSIQNPISSDASFLEHAKFLALLATKASTTGLIARSHSTNSSALAVSFPSVPSISPLPAFHSNIPSSNVIETDNVITQTQYHRPQHRSLPFIFILDEFQEFARKGITSHSSSTVGKQPLLYFICDMLQGAFCPTSIIALTSSLSAYDLLEKRIRSRMPLRTILFPHTVSSLATATSFVSNLLTPSSQKLSQHLQHLSTEGGGLCAKKRPHATTLSASSAVPSSALSSTSTFSSTSLFINASSSTQNHMIGSSAVVQALLLSVKASIEEPNVRNFIIMYCISSGHSAQWFSTLTTLALLIAIRSRFPSPKSLVNSLYPYLKDAILTAAEEHERDNELEKGLQREIQREKERKREKEREERKELERKERRERKEREKNERREKKELKRKQRKKKKENRNEEREGDEEGGKEQTYEDEIEAEAEAKNDDNEDDNDINEENKETEQNENKNDTMTKMDNYDEKIVKKLNTGEESGYSDKIIQFPMTELTISSSNRGKLPEQPGKSKLSEQSIIHSKMKPHKYTSQVGYATGTILQKNSLSISDVAKRIMERSILHNISSSNHILYNPSSKLKEYRQKYRLLQQTSTAAIRHVVRSGLLTNHPLSTTTPLFSSSNNSSSPTLNSRLLHRFNSQIFTIGPEDFWAAYAILLGIPSWSRLRSQIAHSRKDPSFSSNSSSRDLLLGKEPLSPPSNTSLLLSDLSVLELALIVSMLQLEKKNVVPYTFELIYYEYTKFMEQPSFRVGVERSKKAPFSFPREICIKAFHCLLDLGVIVPVYKPSDKSAVGTIESLGTGGSDSAASAGNVLLDRLFRGTTEERKYNAKLSKTSKKLATQQQQPNNAPDDPFAALFGPIKTNEKTDENTSATVGGATSIFISEIGEEGAYGSSEDLSESISIIRNDYAQLSDDKGTSSFSTYETVRLTLDPRECREYILQGGRTESSILSMNDGMIPTWLVQWAEVQISSYAH